MKPLQSALDSWQPAAAGGADPLVLLRAEWPKIVGEAAAANSRPAKIVRSSLEIVARTSQWSEQLSFLTPRILEALRARDAGGIERIRFRVGRVLEAGPSARRSTPSTRRTRRENRPPAESLDAAVARFRSSVGAAERAKAQAGWKECGRCGVRVLPSSGPLCVPCENMRRQEREARVARLLFEVPWLGYAGIAPLVDGLTQHEYYAIRLQLLRRWKDVLERVRRSGGKQVSVRDRMIASSYVLLKSELEPERIAPAVVRNLLGEELHEILYGNNGQ